MLALTKKETADNENTHRQLGIPVGCDFCILTARSFLVTSSSHVFEERTEKKDE